MNSKYVYILVLLINWSLPPIVVVATAPVIPSISIPRATSFISSVAISISTSNWTPTSGTWSWSTVIGSLFKRNTSFFTGFFDSTIYTATMVPIIAGRTRSTARSTARSTTSWSWNWTTWSLPRTRAISTITQTFRSWASAIRTSWCLPLPLFIIFFTVTITNLLNDNFKNVSICNLLMINQINRELKII